MIARRRPLSFSFILPIVVVVCVAHARAQEAPLASFDLALERDTGWVDGSTRTGSFHVGVPGADWLRLRFREIALAPGAKLRMVAEIDGATQELDARQCTEWRNSSCYFNGDGVEVEITAAPGGGESHAILAEVTVGVTMTSASLCGPTDDRQLSSDPRQARVLPIGCTTWIVDDCGHCFVTAGHCATGISVIEFNVPPSGPNGELQHPPPEDQYAPDPVSVQFANGGQGNDWCTYGCYPNPMTGMTPFERQTVAYVLAQASPSNASLSVARVTGYGVDATIPQNNQVQQTAVGVYGPKYGTIIQYAVDTTGGDSGAPVIDDHDGTAIGIHTNGGCLPGAHGMNSGTAIENANLRNALANPKGVCAVHCSPSVDTYCTAKPNSQHCTPAIGASGEPSATAGPGSFWIHADEVINHKPGFLLYGFLSDDRPFMGGTLCIAAPLTRAGGQDSGGNDGPDDCSGVYAVDMGARIASGIDARLHVGATAYAQFWSRDPASQPFTIGLSDAVRFTIGP